MGRDVDGLKKVVCPQSLEETEKVKRKRCPDGGMKSLLVEDVVKWTFLPDVQDQEWNKQRHYQGNAKGVQS